MIDHLFVSGSSVASGYADWPQVSAQKDKVSWVNYFADYAKVNKVWNRSVIGKPIGMSNSDTVKFCRKYMEKYGSLQNLFVIVEFTTPRYRSWEPLRSREFKKDDFIMPIVTVNYKKDYNGQNLDVFFMRDNSTDMSEFPELEIVDKNNINENDLAVFNEKLTQWFDVTDRTALKYLDYAYGEIKHLKEFLEFYNCKYLFYWATTGSTTQAKGTDRYMKNLINERFLPMKEFTAMKAAHEYSGKRTGAHPDQIGHQGIAEYLFKYILEKKLYL